MANWCVFDTETTYGEHYGRVGSTFVPTNSVIRSGMMFSDDAPAEYNVRNFVEVLSKLGGLTGFYSKLLINYNHLVAVTRTVEKIERINPKIFNYKIIVAHNSKFDFLWLLKYYPMETLKWIKRGGVLWCTQYVEYALSGKLNKMCSLTKTAPRYGGFEKYDKIKKDYWSKGIPTEEIPLWELDYYLHYDVHNTWVVFSNQYQILKDKKLLIAANQHFRSMIFTALCEHHGMLLDRDTLMGVRQECSDHNGQLLEQIQAILLKVLPTEALDRFDLSRNAHVSAVLYGGNIKWKDKEAKFYKDKKRYGQCYYRNKEYSVPVKGLGLLLDENNETKIKGVGQTNKKKLLWITGVPFVELLIQYRKMSQLLTTFLNPEGAGILGLIHPDGRIHTSLTHAFTATGRLSSRAPNIQNIDKTSRIRTAFKTRYKEGYIVEFDVKGLENATMAQVCGDANLIKDLNAGVDLHSKRAAQMNDRSYEEIVNNLDKTEYKKMRDDAKAPSFAYAYRAGVKKIVEATRLSEKVVKEFMEANTALYPDTVKFYNNLYEICISKSRPTNLFTKEKNRKRITTYKTAFGWDINILSNDSPVWCVRKDACYKLGNYHPYAIKLRSLAEKNRSQMYPPHPDAVKIGVKFESFTNTVFANYPNQNMADEFLKGLMNLVLTNCIDYTIMNRILPINTIHDSLLFDVYDREHVYILINIIKKCEQDFPAYLLNKFNIKLKVPITLTVTFNKTWKPKED